MAHFFGGRNLENIEAVQSGSHLILRTTRDPKRRGIINLTERWLNTIEPDGLYFEEWFNFLSENIPNKILFKKHYL